MNETSEAERAYLEQFIGDTAPKPESPVNLFMATLCATCHGMRWLGYEDAGGICPECKGVGHVIPRPA